MDVKVVDSEMNAQPCDGESSGEIVARAPWLNMEYVKNPQATADLWKGGYLHTGDVGHIDPDGVLNVTDRIKDVIKTGGEWVSSMALESVASAINGVTEAAAIGIPDPKWGERPVMLLVLATDAQADQVTEDVCAALQAQINAGSLSKWAMPDEILSVASLAKTSVGKIDKKRLRADILQKDRN